MKRFSFEALIYTAFVTGFCLFIAILQGCEPEPVPVSENRVKVEDNFHHAPEKIWTDDDFKRAEAEVDPMDIVYGTCDKLTGDCPPMITVDDVNLINAHHKAKMEKLIAGVK